VREVLVSLIGDSMTKPGDAGGDFIGSFRAHKRPGLGVREGEVPQNGGAQRAGVAMRPTFDGDYRE